MQPERKSKNSLERNFGEIKIEEKEEPDDLNEVSSDMILRDG